MKMLIKTIQMLSILWLLQPLALKAAAVNPDPTVWGANTGAETFNPVGNYFFGQEQIDFASYYTETIFGFYYVGTDPTNAANRIDLWGPWAHNTNPAQGVIVDFTSAGIYDLNTFALLGSFTAMSGPIGFFFEFPLFNDYVLYSQASLNQGQSGFSVFPLLSDPSISLFGLQVTDGNGNPTTLAYEVVGNLVSVPEPATIVPEPATILLLLTGFAAMRNRILYRKFFRNRKGDLPPDRVTLLTP